MERFIRILVLSPTPTWPLDHGNRKRVHSVCKALQDDGAEIDFVYYPAEHDWRRNIPVGVLNEMHRQWGNVFVVPPGRSLHARAEGLDHTIDEWWDPAVGAYLDWLFTLKQYDALFVNYTWLSRALTHAPRGTFKVLDTHDRFAGRRELLASFGIEPEFFHTTDTEEKIALDRADLVLAIKTQEEAIFKRLTSTSVRTLPHMEVGLYVPSERRPDPTRKYLVVGTIGANNSINVKNLQRFLDVAVPIFKKYMAPLEVLIAGGQSDSVERRYPENYVKQLGRVENVDDFYNNVDAVIAPLEFSTGLKIKVCEALARGIPIVSHKHAFEGYPSYHPAHECNSFEEMAMHLVRLSFAPSNLEELQRASVMSIRDTKAQFEVTLRSVMKSSLSRRATILVTVPACYTLKAGYTYHAFISAVRYLRYAARLVFYVPEHSLVSNALIEQELLPLGNVIRGKNDNNILKTLRARIPLCAAMYWELPSETDLKELGGTPIWMRSDAIDERGQSFSEEALIKRLQDYSDVCILDCAEDRAARLSSILHATYETVPFFYEAPAIRTPRIGAVLFCKEEQASLVNAIVSVLETELSQGEPVVVCVDGNNCDLTGFHGSAILLSTLYCDFARTPVGARVLIDLTNQDATFALIREVLVRHKVSEIQLNASPGMQIARWDRPRTTVELVDAIRMALSTPCSVRREFENDDGWGRIWRRVRWATNIAGL